MRTDGEITKEEYNKKRSEYEAQIKNLNGQKTVAVPIHQTADTLDLDRIISALKDISEGKTELGQEFMDEIIYSVVPTDEGVYEWHLFTKPDTETQVNLGVKGRANSKDRPYVYLYGEETEKSASVHIINFDCLRRFLHRRLLLIGINQKIALQWDFPITLEMARAYQKANGKYLRQNQWEDITLVMSLEIGR